MSAYLAALILGIIEGLTEFLPVSSTGHLILAAELMGVHDEKGKLFEVVIQLGAILAICWEYRARLSRVVRGLPSDPASQRFAVNVLVAFLPAAVLGALFIGPIKDVLFQTPIVAAAWILGGVFILWDRLFGTFQEELDKEPVVFGVSVPLRRSACAVFGRLRRSTALTQETNSITPKGFVR